MNESDSTNTSLEDALSAYKKAVPTASAFIEAMMKRGSARAPKKHEIFVHPDFPYCEGVHYPSHFPPEISEHIGKFWRRYRDLIATQLQSSPSPIVLTYGGEHHLHDEPFLRDWILPYEESDTIPTHTLGSTQAGTKVNGKMSFASFQQMMERMEGFNSEDEFLMHGADFADCIADAAEQLGTLSVWQIFQPPDGSKEHQNVIRLALNTHERMRQTRIRIGIVFDARNTYEFLLKNNTPTAIHFNILGPKSNIIPSRDRH